MLVVHNAKDFLVYCWHDPSLKEFLGRGGKVWCVNLAEYLLTAQRCTTAKNTLRALQQRYGARLALTASSAQLVEVVFAQQSSTAVHGAQFLSIQHRMDALYAFTIMEVNGIYGTVTKH